MLMNTSAYRTTCSKNKNLKTTTPLNGWSNCNILVFKQSQKPRHVFLRLAERSNKGTHDVHEIPATLNTASLKHTGGLKKVLLTCFCI